MRRAAFTWMRLIDTFCTPVFGLRAITMPAVMYPPLSCSLCTGIGNSLRTSVEAPSCSTSWHGASPRFTSRHASGLSAARLYAASSCDSGTPIASAIHARRDMKPEMIGTAWPPGCGKYAHCLPSRFLAIAARRCSSGTPGFSTAMRSVSARRCSQRRSVSGEAAFIPAPVRAWRGSGSSDARRRASAGRAATPRRARAPARGRSRRGR